MSDYKIRVDVASDYSLAVESAKINGNLDDLKLKISSVKKENGKNIITFSDGSQAIIRDGVTPYISEDGYWYINGQATGVKARAELSFKELSAAEKLEIKGDKGEPLKFTDLTQSNKEEIRGPRGYTGEASKITKTEYDSYGNTILTFNDGTKATIKKGDKGDKGNTGDSVTVASVSKSGLTNTVRFTDGKTMQVQDGKSVTVSSSRFLTNGDTEITFTDGNKAVIKKGVDGTVDFDKLTETQKQSLVVPVVNDLTTGGTDKALSAEQGKVLFQSVDDGKDLIAKAIIDKDGQASKEDSFSDLASKIKAIKTGYGVGDFIQLDNLKAVVEGQLLPVIDWEFDAHLSYIYSLAVDNQGNVYFGSSDNKVIKISPSGSKVWEFTEHTAGVRSVSVDNQGNIYSGAADKKVIKISSSGSKVWEFTGHTAGVRSVSVDNQGNIYSGSSDNKVIKISPSGSKVWEFTEHTGTVYSLAVDNQDNIYSGAADKKVIKISPSGSKVWEFTGHTSTVYSLEVDGLENVYSGSWDSKVMKIKQEGDTKVVGYEVIKWLVYFMMIVTKYI